MGASVVGQLRILLGLDSAKLFKGMDESLRAFSNFGRDMRKVGANVSGIGESMALGITAPILAAGAGIVKFSGDFEAAMNGLQISSQASSQQMRGMSDLALQLGKDTIFSATQSAGAMDELAKSGLDAQQILGGAAKAAVDLAAAAGSQLEPAAHAITDTLQQFKLKISDLPTVVDQITGAVNQSKFGFEDYALAAAQAGGVAGNLGVSFKDFAAALAGISFNFDSGSDAGTSFKQMLLAIGNPTKKAVGSMQQYGLAFYDAAGKMKPMAAIAEMLRQKLASLSDSDKSKVLSNIFGSDAIRAALGLMAQGGKGLDDLAAKIAKTNAAAQSAERMKGFNMQLEQLKGSLETLAIKIGQSGILDAMTKIVGGIADMVDRLSEASPTALKFGVIFAGLAAAIGPVLIVIGSMIGAIGSISGALVPVIAFLGEAGLAGAFASIAIAAAPFIAAGAFIALEWDKIGPVLGKLWDQVQTTLGPRLLALVDAVKSAFASLWSGPFGSLLKVALSALGTFAATVLRYMGAGLIHTVTAFVDVVTIAFNAIVHAVKLVNAAFSGDWATVWKEAKALVGNAIGGMINIIGDFAGYTPRQIAAMVNSVKDWIVNKLGAVWTWLIGKLKDVGDGFHTLYDRVVGHSYIPDMVDEIAANMARLQAGMVEPAKKAAQATADAFRALKEDTGSILDQLFPDAADVRRLTDELAKIDAALAAKLIDPAVWKAAHDRLTAELEAAKKAAATDLAGPAATPPAGTASPAPEKPAPETTDALRDQFRTAFRDGMRSALDGDFGNWFKNWWKDKLSDALSKSLDSVADQIIKLFSKVKIGGGSSGGGGDVFGSLIKGIGSLFGGGGSPSLAFDTGNLLSDSAVGFANGIDGIVRGRSGIDQNLATMRLSAGEHIKITPANDRGGSGGGGTYIDMRGAVIDEKLWAQVKAIADQSVASAAPSIVNKSISGYENLRQRGFFRGYPR